MLEVTSTVQEQMSGIDFSEIYKKIRTISVSEVYPFTLKLFENNQEFE